MSSADCVKCGSRQHYPVPTCAGESTVELSQRQVGEARAKLADLYVLLAGLNTFAEGNAQHVEKALAVLEVELDAREQYWKEED